MTKELQRLIIAEAYGCQTFDRHQWDERDDRRYFICTRCGEYIGWSDYSKSGGVFNNRCPDSDKDFPNDSNAMLFAEKQLTKEQQLDFAEALTANFTEEFCDLAGTREHIFAISQLDSGQHAEAFIRAIGKWTEEAS